MSERDADGWTWRNSELSYTSSAGNFSDPPTIINTFFQKSMFANWPPPCGNFLFLWDLGKNSQHLTKQEMTWRNFKLAYICIEALGDLEEFRARSMNKIHRLFGKFGAQLHNYIQALWDFHFNMETRVLPIWDWV